MRITNDDSVFSEQPVEIILEERTSIEDLTVMLASNQVIKSESELLWVSKMLGWRTFQKGRYVIDGAYSYDVFLSKLARGIQDPVPVTILPGIDVGRFSVQLSNQLSFDSSSVRELFNNNEFVSSKGLSKEALFGRMLPDTYLMYWTITPKEAINRILKEFESSIIAVYRTKAEELDITIDEAIAMASIVEWEYYIEEEKSKISGLYWNRLNRNMYLQADPTVNYAVGERRRLLFEDYEVDHPFNTYRHKGLPPAAVTNPSISSIIAALNPDDHNYIYMVANPEGGHIFSRTFEEHQIESEKWRKWLRQQYRIKRSREAKAGTASD